MIIRLATTLKIAHVAFQKGWTPLD